MPRAPRACSTPDCTGVIPPGGTCPKCGGRPKFAGGQSQSNVDRSDTAAHRALKQFVRDRAKGQCQIRYEDICLGVGTIMDRIEHDWDYSQENACWSCRPCHARKTAWEALRAQGIDATHLEPRAIVQPPAPEPQPKSPGVWSINTGGHRDQGGYTGDSSSDILDHWRDSR